MSYFYRGAWQGNGDDNLCKSEDIEWEGKEKINCGKKVSGSTAISINLLQICNLQNAYYVYGLLKKAPHSTCTLSNVFN